MNTWKENPYVTDAHISYLYYFIYLLLKKSHGFLFGILDTSSLKTILLLCFPKGCINFSIPYLFQTTVRLRIVVESGFVEWWCKCTTKVSEIKIKWKIHSMSLIIIARCYDLPLLMLFNFVLYLTFLTFFDLSVTGKSFVDETRVRRKYKL